MSPLLDAWMNLRILNLQVPDVGYDGPPQIALLLLCVGVFLFVEFFLPKRSN